MKKPTRDEFEFLSDLKVRHTPTGWEGSTYRYDDPANVRVGNERVVDLSDYDHDEIVAMATTLLRERARK